MSVTEESFLREKATTIYESTTTTVDTQTGEILNRETSTKKRTSTEPDYIKLYYRTMMAVQDIDEIPLSFLLALSSQIGYSNGGGSEVYFYNNKTTRRIISDFCRIGDNMTQKYIRRSVAKGILFPSEDRGTYTVNPWLIAKGRWEHIRELQAQFSFIDGRWTRRMVEDEGADEEATD